MADELTRPADKLFALARKQFGKLSMAEESLLRLAVTGDKILQSNPTKDPQEAHGWGKEGEIRAPLIQWMCVDSEVVKSVAFRGIQALGANIVGSLDLAYSNIPFPLVFRQCKFEHIDLGDAVIIGLNLGGSSIESLNAESIVVKTTLSLYYGFSSESDVMLNAGYIGGSLNCQGASFKRPKSGISIHGDRIEIKGNVNLNDGFSAEGTVQIKEADIGGDFVCTGGTFEDLNLERTVMRKAFFWREVKSSALLDLGHASVGTLTDDEGSWPAKGNLRLDGFVYGGIIGENTPRDTESSLDWLDRQAEFAPQPYRQLAKLFSDIGYDDGAKQVLFEMESRIRAEERRKSDQRIVRLLEGTKDVVSDFTVGYGIYPRRAIYCSGALWALAWIVHRRALRIGAMAPTDKVAYDEFCKGRLPPIISRLALRFTQ
jgi:hypothetical protein